MKKLFVLVLFLSQFVKVFSQRQNVNVEILSDLVSQKQAELKARVLGNIVVKHIRTTNYTTFYSIYNLMDVIVTEKNKTVMTQNIIEAIANYSVTYFLTDYFLKHEYSQPVRGFRGGNLGIDEILDITYGQKKNGSGLQQTVDPAPPKIAGVNSDLLQNFSMDTVFQTLAATKFWTDNGLFTMLKKRKFFNSGFVIDYKSVRSAPEVQTKVLPELMAFLTKVITAPRPAPLNTVAELELLTQININNITGTLTNARIQSLLKIFETSLTIFREQVGNNSFIAAIGDIIDQYFIYDLNGADPDKVYTFKLDVEAIIFALENKFLSSDLASISSIRSHWIGVDPFFSIGLNYGHFVHQDNFPQSLQPAEIAIADYTGRGENWRQTYHG